MNLSDATLNALPEGIERPRYDRAALAPGIVHIGLGNFHRAHQAWYLHRLMQQGLAYDWAIIGAGVRAGDAAQRERLAAQDFLTTLIELDPAQYIVLPHLPSHALLTLACLLVAMPEPLPTLRQRIGQACIGSPMPPKPDNESIAYRITSPDLAECYRRSCR